MIWMSSLRIPSSTGSVKELTRRAGMRFGPIALYSSGKLGITKYPVSGNLFYGFVLVVNVAGKPLSRALSHL